MTSFKRTQRKYVQKAYRVRNWREYETGLRARGRRLGLSQSRLAHRIGAAGKAVVYQWESRRRVPSPVFWRRVEELESR